MKYGLKNPQNQVAEEVLRKVGVDSPIPMHVIRGSKRQFIQDVIESKRTVNVGRKWGNSGKN